MTHFGKISPITWRWLAGLLGLLLAGSHLLLAQQGIRGTALDMDINGVLTVVDRGSAMVRQFSPEGVLLREIGGQGWGNDQFDQPMGVWARNGLDVLVADYGNHRIQRFDKTLTYVSTLFTRDNTNPEERFGYPTSVAMSRLGELYVCDTENGRIVKVAQGNQVDRAFGGYNAGAGRLHRPAMVQCGPGDNVYVLDAPRVLVFDTFGNSLGELMPGLFHDPRCIAATDAWIAVLDSSGLQLFDAAGHPGGRLASDLARQASAVTLSRTQIILLGPQGIAILPLVAGPPDEPILEKDRKNR